MGCHRRIQMASGRDSGGQVSHPTRPFLRLSQALTAGIPAALFSFSFFQNLFSSGEKSAETIHTYRACPTAAKPSDHCVYPRAPIRSRTAVAVLEFRRVSSYVDPGGGQRITLGTSKQFCSRQPTAPALLGDPSCLVQGEGARGGRGKVSSDCRSLGTF